jgi:thiol-disulfide isomerase/thioredoxin
MKKITITLATLAATAQSRITLVEQFTNSSCPPCATYSPLVYNYANANPTQLAVIAYHTSFPYNNDSMNIENATESAARVSYYGIGGTPSSVFDGNIFSGCTGTFGPSIATYVSNRIAVAPKYDIANSFLTVSNNVLNGKFIFKSINNTNALDSLVAHIVVIEKNVLKNSYATSPGNNAETSYGYVMRKMLPNVSGTILLHTNLNASDTISINWNLLHIKDTAQMRVVVFVQNATTKEVYQAQIFDNKNEDVIVVPNATKNIITNNNVLVYPNPNNGNFEISNTDNIVNIAIVNPMGAIVYTQNSVCKSVNINKQLPNGIYNLLITTAKGVQTQKLVIAQ